MPEQPVPAQAGPAKRVAVIAVHGVGDHPPCESVRSIGNLLESLMENGRPRYQMFREHVLRLHVTRTLTRCRMRGVNEKNTWGPMSALARAARKSGHAMWTEDAAAEPAQSQAAPQHSAATSIDHLFMEGQLDEYHGGSPDDTYQTLRVEGARSEGDPQDVDIYEMYWSDLSRLGSAFTAVFSELYQVLFHLTSIGLHNIQAASMAREGRRGSTLWDWFVKAYTGASTLLAWPIAILNLFLIAFVPAIAGISILRTGVTLRQGFLGVVALSTILLAAVLGWLILKRWRGAAEKPGLPPLAAFAIAPAVAVAIGATLLFGLQSRINPEWVDAAAAILLTGASFGVVAIIVGAYDRTRPGSARAARWLGAAFAVILLALGLAGRISAMHAGQYLALVAAVNAIEVLFAMLRVSWVLLALCYLAALVLGFAAVKWAEQGSPKRLGRAYWTALLTVTIPPILFLVLTLAGWTGILRLAAPMLPGDLGAGPPATPCLSICYDPVFHGLTPVLGSLVGAELDRGATNLQVWASNMMDAAGMTFLGVFLGVMLFALLVAAWCLAPVVWAEVNPPSLSTVQQNNEAKVKSFRDAARAMGNWLTDGYRYLTIAGVALILAMAVFLILPSELRALHADGTKLTVMMGAVVVGASAGLIGFRGRLSSLAMGFRPALRVILDVDNWLREHPRDANPTARICARYVSLLRYICGRAGDDAYDAVVIVAHSQGTVITADLLRFLNTEYRDASEGEYDPTLHRILSQELPVYLFTMGCPLRQLYGLRFSYLYSWAFHGKLKQDTFKPNDLVNDHGRAPGPDPVKLGVRQWCNAYRSGDYIGRYLWRSDECGYKWETVGVPQIEAWKRPEALPDFVSADASLSRIEFCIGPGAHTHYWDNTAEPIAAMLDLILRRAEGPGRKAMIAPGSGAR